MKTRNIAVLLLLAGSSWAAITTTQTAQVLHSNHPGTIELKSVHKGDWLKIIVRWTQGGEIIGVFTDNFFDAWYPSPMNFHGGTADQEEFEAVAKQDGDLSVNLDLFLHQDVYYDVRLEEISRQ